MKEIATMPAEKKDGTTARLAEWAASFHLEDAPDEVVERMKALVLDLLRVSAVGARLPWSRSARRLALQLGGAGGSSILLSDERLDAARAAFVNGAYAHACDLDDTHVGSMHHPGASVLPAVLAVGKLLKFNAQDMAGALGAASSYAGGLAQFYHSGPHARRAGRHAARGL